MKKNLFRSLYLCAGILTLNATLANEATKPTAATTNEVAEAHESEEAEDINLTFGLKSDMNFVANVVDSKASFGAYSKKSKLSFGLSTSNYKFGSDIEFALSDRDVNLFNQLKLASFYFTVILPYAEVTLGRFDSMSRYKAVTKSAIDSDIDSHAGGYSISDSTNVMGAQLDLSTRDGSNVNDFEYGFQVSAALSSNMTKSSRTPSPSMSVSAMNVADDRADYKCPVDAVAYVSDSFGVVDFDAAVALNSVIANGSNKNLYKVSAALKFGYDKFVYLLLQYVDNLKSNDKEMRSYTVTAAYDPASYNAGCELPIFVNLMWKLHDNGSKSKMDHTIGATAGMRLFNNALEAGLAGYYVMKGGNSTSKSNHFVVGLRFVADASHTSRA